MGRGNETFGKKEVNAKKDKKRKEKEQKRLERKQNSRDGNNLDEMIAYVDEFGNITSEAPDLSQKTVIKAEDIEIGVPRGAAADPEDAFRRGIVTFFNESKGFGFIKDTSSQKDVFVHVNALIDPIKENNKVIFEIARGPKGYTAVNVKVDKS